MCSITAESANSKIDDVLRKGAAARKIPAIAAAVANADSTLYSGAFGTRDSSGVPLKTDSIFAIHSMTKAVTTVAALQLVEQGKIQLDGPAAKHLPQLAKLDVLEGFDEKSGRPILRPAKTAVTLKHLLTHTSGFCYDSWDERMFHYATWASRQPIPPATTGPLMFAPPGLP